MDNQLPRPFHSCYWRNHQRVSCFCSYPHNLSKLRERSSSKGDKKHNFGTCLPDNSRIGRTDAQNNSCNFVNSSIEFEEQRIKSISDSIPRIVRAWSLIKREKTPLGLDKSTKKEETKLFQILRLNILASLSHLQIWAKKIDLQTLQESDEVQQQRWIRRRHLLHPRSCLSRLHHFEIVCG